MKARGTLGRWEPGAASVAAGAASETCAELAILTTVPGGLGCAAMMSHPHPPRLLCCSLLCRRARAASGECGKLCCACLLFQGAGAVAPSHVMFPALTKILWLPLPSCNAMKAHDVRLGMVSAWGFVLSARYVQCHAHAHPYVRALSCFDTAALCPSFCSCAVEMMHTGTYCSQGLCMPVCC